MKNFLRFMELLKKTLNVLMINTIIFSLINSGIISESYAQQTNSKSNGGFGANEILGLANTAVGMYGSYLGQKQQMLRQQITAANNQKLMAQLSPTCRKPDGSACYSAPAKMFPECTLPASMSSMPVNVCSNPSPEVNQISQMITYEAIAQGWENYYDQMMNEASNSNYPVGLSCLNSKQKAIDAQMTEMINSIQRLQDRLKQDSQIFRDNNKKLLEEMNTANDELFGATKNNLKIKTQDFSKYFSQSCQTVIGREALEKGARDGGLNGILQGVSSKNKEAADFNLNKNAIEEDLRRETSKIASTIQNNGVADFLTNGYIPEGSEGNKSISNVMMKQKAEFETAKKRLEKELAEVGYTAPVMDKNFSVDMEDFIAGSGDFFKKKYVNDCVTGASNGIAIPVEDILRSIEQRSTKNAGTARNDYRSALKNILDSDAMMDDKMASIKDLEAKFPDITITYKDGSQARITESPYNLFMKTIDKCQQRFAQDDKFSSKGSAGVSFQKKVERGRAALQELKNLNDGFSSKITQVISEQVLNCNGAKAKAGSCNEESLKTTSDNFCVSHASVCANNIQGCYAEANNQVQVRKTKMENLAKTFNNNVSSMIARSNGLFEQQKVAVTNMTRLIQSKFPGTNFEIPQDMFVANPELSKDAYGVEMAGNGDLKFLSDSSSMPAKLDKLKEVFSKQKDKVNEATSEYIAQQKGAMEKEKGRWGELLSKCKGAIDSSQKELAKMNVEGQKAQAEQDASVGKFCKKYNSISQNPVGGCGKAQDLAEVADQVSGRLSPQTTSLTEQYASACDGYMNESSASSSANDCSYKEGKEKEICLKALEAQLNNNSKGGSSSKAKAIKFSSICRKSESGYTSDKDLIAKASKMLSPEDQEKLKDVSDMEALLSKIGNNKIEDNGFFSDLNDFAQDESKGNTICEKIKNKIEVAEESTSVKGKLSKEQAASNKIELDSILISLAEINLPEDPNSNESKTSKISQIGEQMTGPCEVQSNSSLTKNMGFDLKSFDSSILGTTR